MSPFSASRFLHTSILVLLQQGGADAGAPWAARKVNAMPPPIRQGIHPGQQ